MNNYSTTALACQTDRGRRPDRRYACAARLNRCTGRWLFTCGSRSCARPAMRVIFQADADLDGRILRGLKHVASEIDIRSALDAGFTGLKDHEGLRVCAESGRVLIHQNRRTMPAHFARFEASNRSRERRCDAPPSGLSLSRGLIPGTARIDSPEGKRIQYGHRGPSAVCGTSVADTLGLRRERQPATPSLPPRRGASSRIHSPVPCCLPPPAHAG